MGPEGGSRGGTVVATGTPEDVAEHPDSHTGRFLAPMLEGRAAQQPAKPRRAPATKAAATKTPARKSAARKAPAKKKAAAKK
jgi:excinuclease ABC subunit A